MDQLTLDLDIAAQAEARIATTTSEIKERFAQYSRYVSSGYPALDGNIDPGEVYKFSKDALQKFVVNELKVDVASEAYDYVASGGFGKGVDLRVPELATMTEAMSQLVGTAAIQNAKEILPEVPAEWAGAASTAIETGMAVVGYVDGIQNAPSGAEAAGVGALAGAKIGASVGSMVPGVGTAVGLVAGAVIGAIGGALFGGKEIPPPPPRVSLKTLQSGSDAAVLQARVNEALRVREEMLAYCSDSERAYWERFDSAYAGIDRAWVNKEVEFGFKFPLRWFDDTHGPAFFADPSELRRIGAQWSIIYRQKQIDPKVAASAMNLASTANYYTYLDSNQNPKTNCALATMGCQYPYVMPGLPSPDGRFGADPKLVALGGYRLSQAFAARDAIWVPQPMRMSCERHLPYPMAFQYATDAGIAGYVQDLQGMSVDIALKEYRMDRAARQIEMDLSRTAAIYKSYLEMQVNKRKFSSTFNTSEIDTMAQQILRGNRLFNNAVLGAGLGVFGYSLWRTFR